MAEEVTPAQPGTPSPEEQAAALQAKEQEITLRENALKAKEMLNSKGLPEGMLAFVQDLDEKKQSARIETLSSLWEEAVGSAVKAKLKGTTPQGLTPPAPAGNFKDMSYAQRLALKRNSPSTYKALVETAKNIH